MKFPKSLLKKNRIVKPSYKLRNHHLVYQRFPPALWDENDEYPDFTQISINQSFNWSAYSIAEWVRFREIEGEIKYSKNYGICSYRISGIREISLESFINILDIIHKPEIKNYSHSELISLNKEIWNDKKTKNKSKKQIKRAIRIQFKEIITLLVKPNKILSNNERMKNYLKMYCDRCY